MFSAPLSVKTYPLAQRIDVGQDADIQCNILEGFPVRLIQWLHNGKLVKQHEFKDDFLIEKVSQVENQELTMTSMTPTAPSYTTNFKLSTPSFVWPQDHKLDKDGNLRLSSDGKVRTSSPTTKNALLHPVCVYTQHSFDGNLFDQGDKWIIFVVWEKCTFPEKKQLFLSFFL